jgi:uncharacterized protein YoaH (UPF0181 family)
MTTEPFHSGVSACPLVQVAQDSAGRYTAQVVGLPDLHATAATWAEAVEQVRLLLAQRLSSGELVALPVAPAMPHKAPGWASNDLVEQEFLAELARRRQEDLERTLREYEEEDRGCSDSSSIATT